MEYVYYPDTTCRRNNSEKVQIDIEWLDEFLSGVDSQGLPGLVDVQQGPPEVVDVVPEVVEGPSEVVDVVGQVDRTG